MKRTFLTHASFRAFTLVELLVVAVVVGVLVIVSLRFTGCGVYESGEAVVKDKYRQLDKYLKDVTVLERANDKLAKAKERRANIANMVKKYRIDAEVAKRQVARIEEASQTLKDAYTTVRKAAEKAGLPKLSLATAEDKAKKITVGATEYTGAQVYAMLKKYNEDVLKGEEKIKIEQLKSDALSSFADKAEKALVQVDSAIAQIENKIAENKGSCGSGSARRARTTGKGKKGSGSQTASKRSVDKFTPNFNSTNSTE
jgi:prepilin-type N-terminal cleavage/methylation domain-containing protein